MAFLVLYVDDILLIGNDIPTWLGKYFSMKDLGEATQILGIRFYRDISKRLIGLSQSTYLDKVLKRFKINDSKKGYLPMQHDIRLSKDQSPRTERELERMYRVSYASTIGSIMYDMTCNKPDFLYDLSMVS